MRKRVKITLAIVLPVIMTSLGYSQTTPAPVQKDAQTTAVAPAKGTFTDANNNGICDNRETARKGTHGRNFVDRNGDGVCDNRDNFRPRQGGCRGMQAYRHQGRGYGYGRGNQACYGQGYRYRHGNPDQVTPPATDQQK